MNLFRGLVSYCSYEVNVPVALNTYQCECLALWIHHRLVESCIRQMSKSGRGCGYISVDEWMFWQWARELHSARGSHPWDDDVFDTMRHSDQNTPPLQHKVWKEPFFFAEPVVDGDVKSLLSVLEDVRAHLQNQTWHDEPGLCRMRPLQVTELTIDLKLHKHVCKAWNLPSINLRQYDAALGTDMWITEQHHVLQTLEGWTVHAFISLYKFIIQLQQWRPGQMELICSESWLFFRLGFISSAANTTSGWCWWECE